MTERKGTPIWWSSCKKRRFNSCLFICEIQPGWVPTIQPLKAASECSSVRKSSKAIKLQVPGSIPGIPFPGRGLPPVKVEGPKLRCLHTGAAVVRQSSVLRGFIRTGRIVNDGL